MITRGILVVFLTSLLSISSTAVGQDGIRWAPDIPTARRAAAQFNVPLLIHFYGDNCLPCKLLEDRVFSRADFVETVNKYFICVKVNATRDRQTAAQYQVHSWPTDVFVSPDGKTLYQGVCQQDINGYLNTLQNVAVMNRDRNVMLAAQQANPSSQNTTAGPPSGQLYSNQLAANAQPVGYQTSAPFNQASSQPPSNQAPVGSQAAVGNQTPVNQAQPGGFGAQPQTGFGQPNNSYANNNQPLQGAAAQLPQNTPMQGNIQRGPLQPAQQPLAQRGPAASTPIGTQGVGYAGVASNGQNSILPNSGSTGSRDSRLSQYPSIPNTKPGTNSTQAVVSTVSTAKPSVNSQSIENPYYTPKQSGVADTAVATGQPSEGSEVAQAQHASNGVSNAAAVGASTTVTASAEQATTPAVASKSSACLEGYCPIALQRGEWVNGDAQYAVRHRGKVYWLSDQSAMEKFLDDPDGASPVLSGYDPLIFLEEGRLVPGDIHFGLHEQVSGSYLLFSSKEAKKKFWGSFDKYTNQLNSVLKAKGAK